MESMPENFETEWLFVVCPPGKRRLLVAAHESTESYNNAGAPELKFMSCLPSGSEHLGEVHKADDLTILDTVYSAEQKKFYIVDVLHWKHYPYYDTEAEFRFFVLPTKYSELKDPTEKKDTVNEYPLELLQKYPCSVQKIGEVLQEAKSKVEGLLFIKKDSLYVTKDSEEVLWLKLDQLKSILDIDIPEGIEYAQTNSKDERKKQEQEDRKKLREARNAAKDKADEEMAVSQATAEDSGDANGEEEYRQQEYTTE